MRNSAGRSVVACVAHSVDPSTRAEATEPTANEPQGSRGPEEGHSYSWVEDYLAWLEGKEARSEYYALLERTTSLE